MSMIAEKNEYTVLIERDEDPMKPCIEYDLMGEIACVHSRYDLGTEQFSSPNDLFLALLKKIDSIDSLQLFWYEMEDRIFGDNPPTNETLRQFQSEVVEFLSKEYVLLPLYLSDHSGLSISTESFGDPWDSGQVGYTYVKNEDACKDWGEKEMTPELCEKVKEALRSDVTLYNHYLQGDSYGYQLFQNGEEIDSCWGFLGDFDSVMNEIACNLPNDFKNLKELLHEDHQPLVTSVMKALPETKKSIFEMLSQNKQRIEETKEKASPLPSRSSDAR